MVGIFDSGSGGLTVLRAIKEKAPKAEVLYFGDIKNAPYGNKSPEELRALTVMAVERLIKEGARQIVSACNSVSARAVLEGVHLADSKNIIEMVSPTVQTLKNSNKKFLLVATKATIASGIYQGGFLKEGIKIETLVIPDLALAIESGTPDTEIERIIESAFYNYRLVTSDYRLVLGCTHFPFARHIFEKVSPGVEIFDPADAVAEEVARRFDTEGDGHIRFLISKDSKIFRHYVQKHFAEYTNAIEVV